MEDIKLELKIGLCDKYLLFKSSKILLSLKLTRVSDLQNIIKKVKESLVNILTYWSHSAS
jgi:hypothetical protein